MRKKLILAAVIVASMACLPSNSQEVVLSYNGSILYIPPYLTNSGESYIYTESNQGFTVYDGDFNIIKTYEDSQYGRNYQERIVEYTCQYDPDTKSLATGWEVKEDQTYDMTTWSGIESLQLYIDDNSYHTQRVYLSQNLFDDDNEFEFIRRRIDIIPIDVKTDDYVREHSSGGNSNVDIISEDNPYAEFGADGWSQIYNPEKDKMMILLHKTERYGGTYIGDFEILNLDGKVKRKLSGINSIEAAYVYRGKFYLWSGRYDGFDCLLSLDKNSTDIKAVVRDDQAVKVTRQGDYLVVEGMGDASQTIVISSLDGKVVRSLPAIKERNIISLSGLAGGVYNVTLYSRTKPLATSKFILK